MLTKILNLINSIAYPTVFATSGLFIIFIFLLSYSVIKEKRALKLFSLAIAAVLLFINLSTAGFIIMQNVKKTKQLKNANLSVEVSLDNYTKIVYN